MNAPKFRKERIISRQPVAAPMDRGQARLFKRRIDREFGPGSCHITRDRQVWVYSFSHDCTGRGWRLWSKIEAPATRVYSGRI